MIAVPVVAKAADEALEQVEEANRKADVIELRLDYLNKTGDDELKRLIKACRKKVIATARPKKEGGLFRGSEERRIALLLKAAKFGADFIDIEAGTQHKLLAKAMRNRGSARVILSYHNFKETPSFEKLRGIFEKMSGKKGVYAVKIVCTAKKSSDNEVCFRLIKYARSKGKRIICFCMGPLGKHSRILSVLLGAYLTFASLKTGLESAAGQIEVDELRGIYNGLSVMF
jgi:3-dehydroquinate dehydratase type I